MVAFKSLSLAMVGLLAIPAMTAPVDCGMIGCGLDQKPLSLGYNSNKDHDDVHTSASADSIVKDINDLAQIAKSIQAPAQSLTLVNGPLIIIGQGPYPEIIKGWTSFVQRATIAISGWQGTSDLKKGSEIDKVVEAWSALANVLGFTLRLESSKVGVSQGTIPFIGQPLAAVHRQVESVTDTLQFILIDSVGNDSKQVAAVQGVAAELSKVTDAAIKAYEGIQVT